MQKYFIKTFGCQMNWSDSERIAGFLEKHNFVPTSNINEASLVVFNTCGVRQMAEDRVYGQIHNLKTRNPQPATIIVTGCLANRKDVQRRLKDKVDLFCEIKDIQKIISNLEFRISNQFSISNDLISKPKDTSKLINLEFNQNSKFKIQNLYPTKESIAYLSITPKHTNNYSAHVPIMTGCNNFCAYCVVPYARGREVSRPPEEIISEVKGLIKNGYKEIILLGQNVNSYCYKSQTTIPSNRDKFQTKHKIQSRVLGTKSKTYNFSQLIKEINKVPGKFWIQFVSNHPKDVTGEMIETVAKCQKVCECFHLPIQAGNDKVLEKMNRKYTAKQYLQLIRKIKAAYKKYKTNSLFAITSDIIVGFPGETRKQFLDSAEIMKKAKYDMVFFGQFSPRPGTAAWNMKDNVSQKEKVRREKYLNEILKKTNLENNKKYVGKVVEVLIENRKDGFYFGRTRTMKNVKVYPVESLRSKDAIGVFHRVKIIKANVWNLEGEIKTAFTKKAAASANAS